MVIRLNLLQGKLIGWKKARIASDTHVYGEIVLVKLEIPADAHAMLPDYEALGNYEALGMYNSFKKCRCSKAKVISFHNALTGRLKKNQHELVVHSDYDTEFLYRLGETVRPRLLSKTKTRPTYDTRRYSRLQIACAPGIHFFLTKNRAMGYPI